MKITFWGVRGSKPTPGENTVLFGGNTSCIQIEIGNKNLIFDGGTGIVELGYEMMKKEGKKEGDIFFSHLHWDHIQGIPFFSPLYHSENSFRLYGENKKEMKFKEIIEKQMEHPYYPITMKAMKSSYEFISIAPNEKIDLGEGISIKTFPLNHPDGSLAFRIDKGNSSVVFSTDTEFMEGEKKKKFIEFIKDADIFIYDTHFTNEEYQGKTDGVSKKNWGHSTHEKGIELSKEAGIGYLILYHYKAERSDKEQAEIERISQKSFENTIASREGMIITIGGDPNEKVVINYPY